MAKWLDASITDKRQWTDTHFSLRIGTPAFDFKAGQFVRIGLEVDGEVLARPYSLVNPPHDSGLEIFFNLVPEGPLTGRLAGLDIGEPVKLSASANGFLVLDEIPDSRELWMLATGTGVGPFLSILRTEQPWQRYDKVVLVYSVRSGDELAYLEVIESIAAQRGDRFVFVPVVTREPVDGALNQRITSALDSGELERLVGSSIEPSRSHVMMCGNSAMIRDVFERLSARGMKKHLRRDPGHITTEKYH